MVFSDGISGGSFIPRLWVEDDLSSGFKIILSSEQRHYLRVVLRFSVGDFILVFNGRDGEWGSRILCLEKRRGILECSECVRDQDYGLDIEYIFAPLKRSRLEYVFEKATEMGVRRLRPVMTSRVNHRHLNFSRLRHCCIEAAEQCGLLWVPEISSIESLESCLSGWDVSRALIFCDEHLCFDDFSAFDISSEVSGYPLSILVGPEGGFTPCEVSLLRSYPFVYPLSLGPRILRGDTACVASLTCIHMLFGYK